MEVQRSFVTLCPTSKKFPEPKSPAAVPAVGPGYCQGLQSPPATALSMGHHWGFLGELVSAYQLVCHQAWSSTRASSCLAGSVERAWQLPCHFLVAKISFGHLVKPLLIAMLFRKHISTAPSAAPPSSTCDGLQDPWLFQSHATHRCLQHARGPMGCILHAHTDQLHLPTPPWTESSPVNMPNELKGKTATDQSRCLCRLPLTDGAVVNAGRHAGDQPWACLGQDVRSNFCCNFNAVILLVVI